MNKHMHQVNIKMCAIVEHVSQWNLDRLMFHFCSRMDGWLKAIFLAFFQTNNPNWFPLNDLSWVHTVRTQSHPQSGHSSLSNLCLQVSLCSTQEAVWERPDHWLGFTTSGHNHVSSQHSPYLVRIWVALWSDLSAWLTTLFTQQNLPVQHNCIQPDKMKTFLI